MTANPLKSIHSDHPSLPSDKTERRRFLMDRGNARLWGQIPNSKGEFLPPRPDLQWHCVNGSWFIGQRMVGSDVHSLSSNRDGVA